MSNKIKNIIEVIGVAVSVLILILLLFILVLYVGLKFNLLKDHPAVIAGLSAALIAFLGVVVSQLWQSSNTNKNIKATQENLEKQLDKQQEALQKQFAEQRDLLVQQNEHALALEDKKLNASRVDKRYEEFEADKKDFYCKAIELSGIIERLFSSRLLSAHALIHINMLSAISFFHQKHNELKKYQQDSNQALDNEGELKKEYQSCFIMLRYLHELKGIGDKNNFNDYCLKLADLEALDKDINEVIEKSKNVHFSSAVISHESKYKNYSAEFYADIELIKNKFTVRHQGEFFCSQKILLDNLREQIVEYN